MTSFWCDLALRECTPGTLTNVMSPQPERVIWMAEREPDPTTAFAGRVEEGGPKVAPPVAPTTPGTGKRAVPREEPPPPAPPPATIDTRPVAQRFAESGE